MFVEGNRGLSVFFIGTLAFLFVTHYENF